MYISIALYSQTSKRNCCAPVEPLAPCFGLSSAGAELAKPEGLALRDLWIHGPTIQSLVVFMGYMEVKWTS